MQWFQSRKCTCNNFFLMEFIIQEQKIVTGDKNELIGLIEWSEVTIPFWVRIWQKGTYTVYRSLKHNSTIVHNIKFRSKYGKKYINNILRYHFDHLWWILLWKYYSYGTGERSNKTTWNQLIKYFSKNLGHNNHSNNLLKMMNAHFFFCLIVFKQS